MTDRCAWCGSPLASPGGRFGPRVAHCARCGAYSTSPTPTERELDEAYAGWYRPEAGRFGSVLDGVLRRTRGRLAARIDQVAPAGTVLDVGAGDGALVDALEAAGRPALGIEREPLGENVRAASLDDVDGPFEAIVFWHSLEHLPLPGEAVRRAASLLAPGGVAFIAVPNADSVQASLFGDRWLALDLPRHLAHLPAHVLLDGLAAAGLRPLRVSYWRGGQVAFGWLHGLVGLLPGSPHLYDALRIPAARSEPMTTSRRLGALLAGALLLPLALACAALEIALRRGGTIYVEARREGYADGAPA
jgi:SAM-dependent methyltransferase